MTLAAKNFNVYFAGNTLLYWIQPFFPVYCNNKISCNNTMKMNFYSPNVSEKNIFYTVVREIKIFSSSFTLFRKTSTTAYIGLFMISYLKKKCLPTKHPSSSLYSFMKNVLQRGHSGPENLKKSRQKNSWNQINRGFFCVKLPFWQF